MYPKVSLAEARRQRDILKNYKSELVTFKTLAEEWLQVKVIPIRVPRHTETVVSRLTHLVCPYIGEKPIQDISAPDVLALLRKIEARGVHETAHRTMQICGQALRVIIDVVTTKIFLLYDIYYGT